MEKLKVSTSESESAAELTEQKNASLAEIISSLKDEIAAKDANLVEIQKKLDENKTSSADDSELVKKLQAEVNNILTIQKLLLTFFLD